jgi:tRNA (Thr-GGU) A37 N-methylase
MDATPRGLFATRAPVRPNPIGLSVVRLERIAGATLHLLDVDMLDGSPLLDIKPYVPRFEPDGTVRGGWSEAVPEADAVRRGRRDWGGPGEADA